MSHPQSRLSTGIDAVDRHMSGGIEPGSLISNVSLRRSASCIGTSRYGLLVSQTRSTRQCLRRACDRTSPNLFGSIAD